MHHADKTMAAMSEPYHLSHGHRSLVDGSTKAWGDIQHACPPAEAALTGPVSCISRHM